MIQRSHLLLAFLTIIPLGFPRAEETHPSALFGPQDVAALKLKATDPQMLPHWQRLQRTARKALRLDFSNPAMQENHKDENAAALAFMTLMSEPGSKERRKFADKARQALANINNGPFRQDKKRFSQRMSWDNSTDVTPWVPGRLLFNYSLAYDWLVGAGELTGPAREKARCRILILLSQEMERQQAPMDKVRKGFTVRGSNKRFVSLSGTGMASLIFPDQRGPIKDPENLTSGRAVSVDSTRVLETVLNDLFEHDGSMPAHDDARQGTLSNYVRPDGGYMEGFQYQRTVFEPMIPFLLAVSRRRGDDVFKQAEGRILKSFDWNLKMMMPDGNMPTIDSTHMKEWPAGHGWMLRNLAHPAWHRWFFEKYSSRLDSPLFNFILTPLIGPAAERPGYRTEFMPESGMAVFRENTGPDATYLLFMNQNYPVMSSHNQADQTSFVLFSKGAYLAIDPGQGSVYRKDKIYEKGSKENWLHTGLAHNLITVDSSLDKGVHPSLQYSFTNAIDLSQLVETRAENHLDFAEAQLGYSGVDVKLTRQIIFPRHRYFIIADQLTSPHKHDYVWQIHLGGAETGALAVAQNRRTWTMPNNEGRRVSLDIDFLSGALTISTKPGQPTDLWRSGKETHTSLIAEQTAADTRYLTVLSPRWTEEPAVSVTPVLSEKMWKVDLGNGSHDLLISRYENDVLDREGIKTDAKFVVASFDDGQLKSVLAKDGTSLTWKGMSLKLEAGKTTYREF